MSLIIFIIDVIKVTQFCNQQSIFMFINKSLIVIKHHYMILSQKHYRDKNNNINLCGKTHKIINKQIHNKFKFICFFKVFCLSLEDKTLNKHNINWRQSIRDNLSILIILSFDMNFNRSWLMSNYNLHHNND